MLLPDGDAPALARNVRAVPGDHCIVGKGSKARGRSGHQSLNLPKPFLAV